MGGFLASMKGWLLVTVFAAVILVDQSTALPFQNFVEEPANDGAAMTISRECFQRSCTQFMGHTECRLGRIACQPGTNWQMAEPERLVETSALESQAPGLVDIVQHKRAFDPNTAISMPGIPAKASASLMRAMKQQEKLLNKIVRMEKIEEKMDPLHKQQRLKWLKLAKSVRHMANSPEKLKNEHLLLQLARNLAKKEQMEHEKMKKLGIKIPTKAPSSKHKVKTTTYSRCFEKACLKKASNGFCGAAVVSCQQMAPKHDSKQAKVVKAAMQHEAKAAMERAALAKVLPFLKKLATAQEKEQEQFVVPEVSEMEMPEMPENLPEQFTAEDPFYQQQTMLYEEMLQKP